MADQHDELWYAIRENDFDRVVLDIESGADVNGYYMFGNYKYYHLYMACEKSGKGLNCVGPAINIIKYLISKGADLNSVNGPCDLTPLHFTACCGYIEYVVVLLEAGADVDICDRDGRTALECAEFNGKHEIAEYIRSYDLPVKGVNQ